MYMVLDGIHSGQAHLVITKLANGIYTSINIEVLRKLLLPYVQYFSLKLWGAEEPSYSVGPWPLYETWP